MSASILSPSEVLSLYDDDMFDEAEEAAAAAAAAGGGGGGGAGGGYSAAAPHGAAHASLEEAAGHARVASHPLWPVLVELYFACRKARRGSNSCRRTASRLALLRAPPLTRAPPPPRPRR